MDITNTSPTFIFVDASYFIFHRYYALRSWLKIGSSIEEQEELSNNPILSAKFVETYTRSFIDKFRSIPTNLDIADNVTPIMIVGKDCPRSEIWRTKLFPSYKNNRPNKSNIKPFFQLTYDNELFIKGGAKAILQHPHLEADDCIAISVKHLLKTYPKCSINIITADKDYLQLVGPRVVIYDLKFNKLTDQKSSLGSPECDLFCKIVAGDISDNIVSIFPKCGPKTALKYFENMELFEKKLQESEEYRDKYLLNTTLIDFNRIPEVLVEEFMTSPVKYILDVYEIVQ